MRHDDIKAHPHIVKDKVVPCCGKDCRGFTAPLPQRSKS